MTVHLPPSVPDLAIEALWDLLGAQRRGILATIKPDGRPQLSNMSYLYDPESRIVRMTAAAFRAKTRNLTRDPRASLHVSNDAFTLWLVAEGTVEITEPARDLSDPVAQEIIAISEHGKPPRTPEQREEEIKLYPVIDRCVIRLHVDRIYGGNASAALGISGS